MRKRRGAYDDGEMSFSEIGRAMGFSGQRAQQLYKKAMFKLRKNRQLANLALLVNSKRRLLLRTLPLVVLIAGALFASPARQDGMAKYCDNRRDGKGTLTDHTCECARAMKQCDPDDPEIQTPGAMCRTYCKPDNCHCENMCTRS